MIKAGKRLLCIENQNEMLALYRLILASSQCEVIDAREGNEGLSEARAILPDVILLDLLMPGMDGWQVLRELKSDSATSNIPVIVVSAQMNDSKNISALEVEDYITKPFEPRALKASVNRVLARSVN